MMSKRGVPVAGRASQRSVHDSSCSSGLLAQDTASAHHPLHSDTGSSLFMYPEHCSLLPQALFDPLCYHEAVLHSKRTCAASLTTASTELAEVPDLLMHLLLHQQQHIGIVFLCSVVFRSKVIQQHQHFCWNRDLGPSFELQQVPFPDWLRAPDVVLWIASHVAIVCMPAICMQVCPPFTRLYSPNSCPLLHPLLCISFDGNWFCSSYRSAHALCV